jgi:dethiobiotin synthetase
VIVVIAGTGTGVGKTWCARHTIGALRTQGSSVAARKPAQSFDPGEASPTDAELLAAASGEERHVVCPADRWYPVAMAPPMAAAALGRPPFTIADLVREVAPTDRDLTLVESAGGVRSPLASDGDTVGLCRALAPAAVVLVADAGLGTINAVRLSWAALDGQHVVIALNRYDGSDDVHRRNAEWLRDVDGFEVVDSPTALTTWITQLLDVRR